MELIEDVNNKTNKHIKKNTYWLKNNIKVSRYRLPVGDYALVNDKMQDMLDRKEKRGIQPKMMDFMGTYDVVVDSKNSIAELSEDICGKQHERFRDSLLLAQNNGIKMYILVENDFEWVNEKKGICNKPITDLSELHSWKNPRLFIMQNGHQKYPKAVRGINLMKACYTMESKYGCKFVFCSSRDAGAKVIELLNS